MILSQTTLTFEVAKINGVQGEVELVVVVVHMEQEMMRKKSDYPFLLFVFDRLKQFYFVCVFFMFIFLNF